MPNELYGVAPQARGNERAGRTDGLFFAVVPGPQVAAQINSCAQRFCDELSLKGFPPEPDQFHITLYYLGAHAGFPLGIAAKARETAASVRAAPFEVSFDRARSFPERAGNRPLVLCSSKVLTSLNAFQRTLRAAIGGAGLDNWPQPSFTPHVTLLFDRRRVPEQAVDPIGWTVSEFVLVRSLLGQSRHETLARWPLAA